MIKLLEQLKDGRDNYKNSNDYVTPVGPEHPLFDEKTVKLLFDSTDIMEKGVLPTSACISICEIIGVSNSDELQALRRRGHK